MQVKNDAIVRTKSITDQYISEVQINKLYILELKENDCFGINSMLLQVFQYLRFNDIQDEILCTNTPGEAGSILQRNCQVTK